ncbi:hypothetical protein ACFL51_02030, partial [Myxococcota bacterium]
TVGTKGKIIVSNIADTPDPFDPSIEASELTFDLEIIDLPGLASGKYDYTARVFQHLYSSWTGVIARTIVYESPLSDTGIIPVTLQWDGTDDFGTPLSDGEYYYHVVADVVREDTQKGKSQVLDYVVTDQYASSIERLESIPPPEPAAISEGSPSVPISINFSGVGSFSPMESDSIGITLVNNTPHTINAWIALHTSGLINKKAIFDLGQASVYGYGTRTFVVSADDVPIQSLDGSNQAIVFAKYNILGEPHLRGMTSATIYYHHNNSYEAVITYPLQILIDEFGGVRSRITYDDVLSSKYIGRIKRQGIGFEDVYADDPDFVLQSDSGDFSIRLLGSAIRTDSPRAPVTQDTNSIGSAQILNSPGNSPSTSICFWWHTFLKDADYGEDFMTQRHEGISPAAYTYFEHFHRPLGSSDPWQLWWNGFTGSPGCVYGLQHTPQLEYRVSQFTFLGEYGSNRRVYIGPELTDWDDITFHVNAFYMVAAAPGGSGSPGSSYVNLILDWNHDYTNIAAVYGQLLSRHADLNWPSDADVRVKRWHDDCDTTREGDIINDNPDGIIEPCTFNKPPDYNICLGGMITFPCYREVSQWKYVIAHETGHRMAYLLDGPIRLQNDSYSYHEPTTRACRCDHVTSSNQLHCLQSKEYAHAARIEGFAHFWASVAFNNRFDGDGVFVHGKEFFEPDYDQNGNPLETGIIISPPIYVNLTEKVRWMDNNCNLNSIDRGTEWDWLLFFWALWTSPIQEALFNVADIALIFHNLPVPQVDATWANLEQTVLATFTGEQYELFTEEGEYCGVDN